MRRLLITSILTAIAAMTAPVAVSADAVYHSEHLTLRPIGEAPLRSGFVENIHADGPNVYAHEQYVLNGAAPNSSYQVVLMIFPTDTTCSSSSPSIPIPTATITTNAAGNGNAFHVFAPADADGPPRPHGWWDVACNERSHGRVRNPVHEDSSRLTQVGGLAMPFVALTTSYVYFDARGAS